MEPLDNGTGVDAISAMCRSRESRLSNSTESSGASTAEKGAVSVCHVRGALASLDSACTSLDPLEDDGDCCIRCTRSVTMKGAFCGEVHDWAASARKVADRLGGKCSSGPRWT